MIMLVTSCDRPAPERRPERDFSCIDTPGLAHCLLKEMVNFREGHRGRAGPGQSGRPLMAPHSPAGPLTGCPGPSRPLLPATPLQAPPFTSSALRKPRPPPLASASPTANSLSDAIRFPPCSRPRANHGLSRPWRHASQPMSESHDGRNPGGAARGADGGAGDAGRRVPSPPVPPWQRCPAPRPRACSSSPAKRPTLPAPPLPGISPSSCRQEPTPASRGWRTRSRPASGSGSRT